jgi:hypothetical protein
MKRLVFLVSLIWVSVAFAGPPASPPVDVSGVISTHNLDTTSVHGITDTSLLYDTTSTVTDSIRWNAAGTAGDGVYCGYANLVQINSGPYQYSIICQDSDSSTIYGNTVMRDGWDAGTITFELEYVQTAVNTGVLNSDIACACRGPGETVNNTWGTEIAIDDAAVTGSSGVDHTTSAAVTCNGTCVAGDTLYWRWQMDATGTTTAVATLNILGVKAEYTATLGD